MKRDTRGNIHGLLMQKYYGICLARLRKSMNNLRLDVFYLAGIHTVDFQISVMHDIAVLRASHQRLLMCKKLPCIILFDSITTKFFSDCCIIFTYKIFTFIDTAIVTSCPIITSRHFPCNKPKQQQTKNKVQKRKL
jgi:hypothetical protein